VAHEILSVKLCELDEKLGAVHSRIHFSETAGRSRLKQEIEALERECGEEELALSKKLKFSKAYAASSLSGPYEEIERIIKKAMTEQETHKTSSGDQNYFTEEDILRAEYALDFAMQAADRALLMAMKAIEAQMTQEEQEEGSRA
jgi:hypothetical protein